ncbi:MAG TPA: GlxA family transcriptional regulator [Dongiaceae bacterium]|jgi:AraC family carnitine catabolism transcriptional activator|nr:GlxA family transcriptional regulator [Dongiaceae bacterium]
MEVPLAEDTRKLAFLLTPAFSALGLSASVEALFIANWLSGRRLYDWRLLSRDGGDVRASSGLRFPVDGGLAGPASYAAVFVLASFEPKENARDPKIRDWLRRMARHGAELVGIETGSEILAAAGLLDGAEVAVHWDNLQGFREVYPRCRALPQLFTAGRGRMTCAGESAVLDMMLHWIGAQHGPALAREIADHLLLRRRRPAAEPQLAAAAHPAELRDPLLAGAIALMAQNIEEPLGLGDIAQHLGLSLRQLQRLFARHLGETPLGHYKMMRLAKAHALLQQTRLPVTEVALSAGFASPEHFSRLYRRTFGRSPRADRRQSPDAPVLRRRKESAP